MARISDEDALRIAAELGAGAPVSKLGIEHGESRGEDALRRIKALFSDHAATDALGRTLTLDLASYLNRPVRCSVVPTAPPPAAGWRFEAPDAGLVWWLVLDPVLAGAFADAMIGGDGAATLGHGRRVRMLVERIAIRMLRCVAAAAGLNAPDRAASVSDSDGNEALAGGLCAVAADQFAWQMGIEIQVPVRRESPDRFSVLQPASAASPNPVIPFAAPAQFSDDPESVIRSAVAGLCTHLQEILRCQVSAAKPVVAVLDGADLNEIPAAPLRLALTAGGKGALMTCLDRDAVSGLAGGAAGAALPATEFSGDVVIAAAEAIVRDALRDFVSRLPGIGPETPRAVRLGENPLPARTPHHSIDVRLTVGGRSGSMWLLVPSWMLVRS